MTRKQPEQSRNSSKRAPGKKHGAFPEFARLVGIMARLRAPGGCPWDRAQKKKDLKTYLVEETYEVLDAIDSGSDGKLREELGDLLLQIVFHAQIASERKKFDIEDVAGSINEKLVRRHPHVFAGADARTPEAVLKNWEKIKKGEKQGKSVFEGVPKILPALLKAFRLQEKAARVGFDWEEERQVEAKVEEELAELKDAVRSGKKSKVREELGDLLFAIVNLSRFLKLDPEDTLQAANEKFIRRFKSVEKKALESGRDIHGMSLREMDDLWEAAKKEERPKKNG